MAGADEDDDPPVTGPARRAAPQLGVALLRSYQRAWLAPDVLAGLTVAAMLVPQSLAYAALAGLPPEAGFRAALPAVVVYALLGTSRHLGAGPEPGTAVLAAAGVGALAAGDPDRYAALMAALAVVVGVVGIVGALARLGFIASLLSRPVLVGYLTGVGLTLVTSQLRSFTGIPVTADKPLARLGQLVTNLDRTAAVSLALGAATLTAILALRRWAPRLPSALIGVAAATVATAVLALDERGVAVLGPVAGALPVPGIPAVSWTDAWALVPTALGVTLVGFTDNVLTARAIASRLGYAVDGNQELAALGASNLAAGLGGGFPVSSSASRSAVPASLGSKSSLVSLVAAVTVAATIVFLGPVLATFPMPAIGAVILAAAFAIIDVPGFLALWRTSRSECALAAATTAGVVVLDVLSGVAIAVGLSILVSVYRIARPHDAVLGAGEDLDGWVDVDDGARTLPGLLVYRFDAPLFFANATWFGDRVRHMLAENPGDEEWLVLDFEGVGSIDTTALDELAAVVGEVRAAGVATVAVARANHPVCELLGRAGLLEPEGPLRVFPTINRAVREFEGRGGA